MPVGLLPGCEISFPFLTPAVAIREKKDQSLWTLGYQGAKAVVSPEVLSRLHQQGIEGAASVS